MDPSIALIVSIFLILVLIRLNVNISLSIFAGALTLGCLTIGIGSFYRIFATATSLSTLKLIAIVLASFTLGHSMEYFKLLESMTSAVSKMMGMLSIVILPLIIGFLPMPGGALISAIMLGGLVKQYDLSPKRSTFINYWFRHIWVPVWPLYPSFILAAAIVEIGYSELFLATYPIMLAAALSGALLTGKMEKKNGKVSLKEVVTLLCSLYPIIIVAALALIFRFDLLFTLLLVLLMLYVHKKPSFRDIRQIIRTIDVKIVILIFAVMSYKDLIAYTNAAEAFFENLCYLNISPAAAAFLLSFAIGFATGIELSYASVALPLLITFTGVADMFIAKNLMLVFGAGFLGVMLSPMHLCLVLSAEYFKANLGEVYRLLLPSGTILAALIIALFLI